MNDIRMSGPEKMPGGPPPGAPAEPVPKLAEVLLHDYAKLKNRQAVSFVLDLGLMQPQKDELGQLIFSEDLPITEADLAAANKGMQELSISGIPTECLPSLPKIATRGELAQTLMDTLTAGGVGLPDIHYDEEIRVSAGTVSLEGAYVFYSGGNAVENSGTSELIVRNSIIRGTTTKTSAPLSGPPSGLLISGSIRTTLALNRAQAYYINSHVTSRDWAVFSTDGAEPAEQDDQKELSIYTYGTKGSAETGGYGTYSDLFCHAAFYGSEIVAPELGAISGTFGTLTFSTIGAGEQDPALSKVLTEQDRATQPRKDLGSHLVGGRNAVMIHCVSLPPYWVRPGYSQTELPLHSGILTAVGSCLETKLSLDLNIAYPDQLPPYIAHHRGSVILVKSCNAEIDLTDCCLIADQNGSGAILHTVINSDLNFMVRVPDGTVYPGVRAVLRDMSALGNILHEDYQRDLCLTLENCQLTGRIITGTAASWNNLCQREGFTDYIIDPDGYKTVHGSHITIGAGSCWTVTGESCLNDLTLEDGGHVTAPNGKALRVTVNGTETTLTIGHYHGDIRLSCV